MYYDRQIWVCGARISQNVILAKAGTHVRRFLVKDHKSSAHAMANVDGMITPIEDARVSVLDRGFLYGDSVYEVVRTYDGVPFYLEEHLQRLHRSAVAIGMTIDMRNDRIVEEIARTVQHMGAVRGRDEVMVRFSFSRGVGMLELAPEPFLHETFVVMAKVMPPWANHFFDNGMRVMIPSVRRNSPDSLHPNIKSGNYLNNILGIREAKAAGYDDALFLTLDNALSELANSNIFIVKNGVVLTPDPKAGALAGITKAITETCCGDLGIPCEERRVDLRELLSADECFATSSTREVMPVREVMLQDGSILEFPKGGGPLTRQLGKAFKEEALRYTHAHMRNAWIP